MQGSGCTRSPFRQQCGSAGPSMLLQNPVRGAGLNARESEREKERYRERERERERGERDSHKEREREREREKSHEADVIRDFNPTAVEHMAHTRQSRPDSGFGSQVKVPESFSAIAFALESGSEYLRCDDVSGSMPT